MEKKTYKAKGRCRQGHEIIQLCEYPKCVFTGFKRLAIWRLCDFHESRFPFLCDDHYREIKRGMKGRDNKVQGGFQVLEDKKLLDLAEQVRQKEEATLPKDNEAF